MSREAGMRGHVTGEAGRLRGAHLGAGCRIRSAVNVASCSGSDQFVFSAPLAGMRAKRMLPAADTVAQKPCSTVEEAAA